MVSTLASPSLHSTDRRKSLMSTAAEALPAPAYFRSLRMPEEKLKAIKNRKIREFYKHQNEMIDRFEQVDRIVDALKRGDDLGVPLYGSLSKSPNPVIDDEESFMSFHGRYVTETENEPLLGEGSKSSERSPQWLVRLAINLSFVANIAVFVAKIVLALFTGSMSILASAFESFLDILSNGIIFFTVLLIRQKDYYAYPVGKSRMEPLGIIVFAVIITTSFSQVLVTSIQRLIDPDKMAEELDLSTASLVVLVANIIVKGVLWIWCLSIKGSSSVQALAQDHENDVVFNVASTIFPVVAMWANWPWLDPVGAIALSIYIIYEWMVVLVDNIRRLTGRAASPDDLKQLTYMAYRFSRKIQAVDTVRAYYVGDRLLVEVDIVMPPDCPLKEAHDVGEALQDALELMENVERAFVHLDYNQEHAIEHQTVVESIGFGQ